MSREEARQYFIDAAANLDLDTDQFSEDLDGAYTAYLSAMEQEAINIGLPGTPAIIFEDFLLASNGLPSTFEDLDQLVQFGLALAEIEDMQYDAPPEMTIDPEQSYQARVQMATGEEFVIELLPQSAPQTVNNFVFLAEEGWFDGVTFHRVLPGFVAQTGDPSGTGAGGPGYTIPNEIDPELSHDQAGMVAMANSGPDTNGSQWYITLGDVSQLDGNYTIFGRVVEGMDVVEGITPRENPSDPSGDVIESITIEVGE